MAEDKIKDIIPEDSEELNEQEDPESKLKDTLQKIKDTASEEDPHPSSLIVAFTIVYVAFRYQCQQDLLNIDRLENQLKDAKFKALSSSSTLTEKCRESHVLDILKQNKDSLLHQADQPPYIIQVPE